MMTEAITDSPDPEISVKLSMRLSLKKQMRRLRALTDPWQDAWRQIVRREFGRKAQCTFAMIKCRYNGKFVFLRYQAIPLAHEKRIQID